MIEKPRRELTRAAVVMLGILADEDPRGAVLLVPATVACLEDAERASLFDLEELTDLRAEVARIAAAEIDGAN